MKNIEYLIKMIVLVSLISFLFCDVNAVLAQSSINETTLQMVQSARYDQIDQTENVRLINIDIRPINLDIRPINLDDIFVTPQDSTPNNPDDQRRIIDVNNPPKPAPLQHIIFVPFHPIANLVDKLIDHFQRNLNSGASPKRGLVITPLIDGFHSDSSSLGGGIKFSNGTPLPLNLTFFSATKVSLNKYFETSAGLNFDPTGNQGRFFNIDLIAHYYLKPEEYFSGLGPLSLRTNRTIYDLQERGIDLDASFKLTSKLKLGAGIDYTAIRIFNGRRIDFPSTNMVFPDLPGIANGAALLGTALFLEFDDRDNVKYPRSGFYGKFEVSSHDSVGRDDFGFVTYQFDTRSYMPLGTKTRIFAMRVVGEFNEPKGGSAIPFFWLSRLGSKEILRGYSPDRFYGRNALASSLEYRYEIGRFIDAILFTDLGQVFNNNSELKWSNVHVTFGGGFQFKSSERSLFKILAGKSGDGMRLILNFGPTF